MCVRDHDSKEREENGILGSNTGSHGRGDGRYHRRTQMPLTHRPPSPTEMYDTPTLSVHPGPQVVSGKNVTFYCHLETATSTFFLLKEGRPGRPQRRQTWEQPGGIPPGPREHGPQRNVQVLRFLQQPCLVFPQ